jgi:hypothetical protein
MVAIRVLLLSITASLVSSHFLPIKQDPADALVDKMIQGAGIDAAALAPGKLSDMNWKAPTMPDEPAEAQMDHKRFTKQDLVKSPIVSIAAAGLVAPKEWESEPETQESPSPQSVLANEKKSFDQNLNAEVYHEIVSQHQSHSGSDDGEMPSKSIAGTVDQELQNLKPKDVIKVFDRDTKVHEPAYKPVGQGLANLGKSLETYGPIAHNEPLIPNFSIHHGNYRPTTTTTSTTVQPTTTTDAVVAPAKDAPRNSVMNSVHHSKRTAVRFPILPEDIHHGESTSPKPSSASQSHPNTTNSSGANIPGKQHDKVVKLKGHRSKPLSKSSSQSPSDKFTNLFNANSAGGQMDGDSVEKVLRFMKVQKGWNWHPFDLNSDGKLSHQEFMNAARVAQRFKISKK